MHTLQLATDDNVMPYPYIRIKIPVDKSQREYMQLKQTTNKVTKDTVEVAMEVNKSLCTAF